MCASYKQIEQYRHQAISYVSPYAQPYVNTVKSQAEQYYTPYVKAAQPYTTKVHQILAPQSKRVKSIYEGNIKPRLMNAVTHSHKQVRPHINDLTKRYEKAVTPTLNHYIGLVEELYDLNIHPRVESAQHFLNKRYGPLYNKASAQVNSLTSKAYPVAQHHVKHTFIPFASKTYATSADIFGNQVHPRLLTTWEYVKALLRGHFVPALKRFNSKYISPQVSKIQDKAWANRAKNVADEKVKEMDENLGKVELEQEVSGKSLCTLCM